MKVALRDYITKPNVFSRRKVLAKNNIPPRNNVACAHRRIFKAAVHFQSRLRTRRYCIV